MNQIPWIAYGQSLLPPNTIVLNPTTLSAGLMGEASLPYTVPDGKILIIDRVAIEAHWGTAAWLWTGSAPFTWEKAIETYKTDERAQYDPGDEAISAITRTQEWHPTKYLPSGLTLNIALSSQNQPHNHTMRQGWEVSGRLCDALA